MKSSRQSQLLDCTTGALHSTESSEIKQAILEEALETSSLFSSGVVTPITTSSTNLSLFSQSQRHGLSSSWARRHALCGPRDKFSTFPGVATHSSTNLSLFSQSQKLGWANRVVGWVKSTQGQPPDFL